MKILNRPKITFSLGGKTILIALFSLLLSFQIYANPGRLDFSFQSVLAEGANIRAIEVQADGKILAAGSLTTRGAVFRKDVVRLNADGSLDTTFNIGSGADESILVMKLQADGKIIIGGNFSRINGVFRSALARLNADGSVDRTFDVSGVNVTYVYDLDLQTDGKILISANNLNGTIFVTRLKTDGSDDPAFAFFAISGATFKYTVTFVPTENKVLVSGNFNYTVNQTQYKNLARLNSDGTIDSTFTASVVNSQFNTDFNVEPISSGKILIWGAFDTVNQIMRRTIAVLNNNGSLDTSFNSAATGDRETILSLAVQPNGKIIIGGIFNTTNTFLRGSVARLNADGSVDPTFNQGRGANGAVKILKIKNNNKLLIGGDFFRYNSVPRSVLAQLNL